MVLIGYWPLNESSGSTAYDHSGNENHGSLNGGVTQGATGILGTTAYSFDGTDDNVSTSATLSDYIFSFSFWFKTNSSNSGSLVSAYDDSANDGVYIDQMSSGEGNFIEVKYERGSSSNGDMIKTQNTYNDGKWHHIVVAKNSIGTSDFTIYMDGTEDKSIIETNNHNALDSARAVRIGKHQTNNNEGLPANISSVRYYNHALTPAEVQYLYNVSKTGRQVTSEKKS